MANRTPVIPTSYRKPRRNAPAGRPHVVTGLGSQWSPFDAFSSRRPPADSELVSAYRNATYVCASYAAEGMASLPLHLYAITDRRQGHKALRCRSKSLSRAQERHLEANPVLMKKLAGVDRVDEVTESPLLDTLDYVNPWMNRSQLIELTQLYLDITGKYFWVYVRGVGDRPIELWPLPTWLVYVQPDFAGTEVVQNFIFTGGGGQTILDKHNVLFGRELSLIDPYTQGMGALRANWGLAEIYDKQTAYRDATLSNRGRPDAMLIPTEDDGGTTMGDEAIQRIQVEYEQEYSRGKAGKLWCPPGGVKLEPINWSPTDMGDIALTKSVLHDIARAFKIPISLVDGEASSRANMDASILMFARFCLKPRARKLEQHLNSNFVNEWDDRLFVAFDDPVPADKKAETEENIAYVTAGIRTRGQVRTTLGDEPMEGDDVLLVANNLVPLSHAIEPPPAPVAPGQNGKPASSGKPGDESDDEGDDDAFEEGDDNESGAAGKALRREGEQRPFFPAYRPDPRPMATRTASPRRTPSSPAA